MDILTRSVICDADLAAPQWKDHRGATAIQPQGVAQARHRAP